MLKQLPPLSERIRDILLDRIKKRETDAQGRLPSEEELAQEFGISRTTIRNALTMLANQGIIVRKQGSGTFVNKAMLNLMLDVSEQWEFADLIRSSGYLPAIQFIDSDLIAANQEIASALDIKPGDEVLQIRKIFTADDRPAVFSINLMSTNLVKPPYNQKKLQGEIFPFLSDSYNLSPAYSVAEVVPQNAPDELAKLLKIKENSAILLLKDIFLDLDNHPIMYANNYYTEILRFKAIRQPSVNWL